MASLPNLLKQYGLYPTHSLGQVFLSDDKVMHFISQTLNPGLNDTVIEIGAGPGLITRELARRSGKVIAVEIDRKFEAMHKTLMADLKTPPHMIYDDARRVDYASLLKRHQGRLLVFGNLPYYMTTELILMALHHFPAMSQALFMIEHEVSERLVAQAGTKKYGTLSVVTNLFGTWRYERSVGRASFYPRPRVTSALMSLHPSDSEDDKRMAADLSFHRFLTSLFQYRRKTLQNALKLSEYWSDDEPFAESLSSFFEAQGLTTALRAEQLGPPQLARLFDIVSSFVRTCGLL